GERFNFNNAGNQRFRRRRIHSLVVCIECGLKKLIHPVIIRYVIHAEIDMSDGPDLIVFSQPTATTQVDFIIEGEPSSCEIRNQRSSFDGHIEHTLLCFTLPELVDKSACPLVQCEENAIELF